jgi:hypothetical protein
VYVEGLAGNIYVERETDVARYGEVFDDLRDMALDPSGSGAYVSLSKAKHGELSRWAAM